MYLYDKKLLEKCSCLICHKLVTATGLNQHYFKSHTEEGQLLVKNSRDKLKSYYSNLKDITTQKKKLILRIEQYNLNPKLCQLCQNRSSTERKINSVLLPVLLKSIINKDQQNIHLEKVIQDLKH